MPFVAIDHVVEFAIDAIIKASNAQQVDQNIDWLYDSITNLLSGHDHDGVNSKAVAAVGADIIQESNIDWANAGGIGQGCIKELSNTVAGTSFQTMFTIKLYVPPNATSIEYYIEARASSTGTLTGRLNVGGVNGSTTNTQWPGGSGRAWKGADTLTTTGIGTGWVTINVQLQNQTSNTSNQVHGVAWRII